MRACSCPARTAPLVLRLELVEALTTLPLNEPVARYESRPGISIENVGVWSSSVKPPIWKSENAARLRSVPQRLGGGDLHRLRARSRASPNWLPNHELEQRDRHQRRSAPASRPAEERRRCGRAARCQQADAEARRPTPAISPARIAWPYAQSANSLESSSQTLVSCASPFDDLVADRVLHPRVRDEDEVRRQPGAEPRRSRSSRGGRAARAGSSRRSRGRGTSPRARTRRGPRSRAARRRRRRRTRE